MENNPYLKVVGSMVEDDEEEISTGLTVPRSSGNPYTDVVDEISKESTASENVNYNIAVDSAIRNDPDRFAQIKDLSSQVGVSPEVGERNEEAIKHESRKRELDYQSLAKKNPILARQLSNLEFAKVAHDDVEALGNIESTARFIVDGQAPFDKTRRLLGGLGKDFLGRTLSGVGEATDMFTRFVDREMKGIVGDQIYEEAGGDTDNIVGEFFNFYGEGTKDFFDDYVIPEQEPTKGGQVAAGLGQVAGQLISTALAPQIAFPSMLAQGVDITRERIANDPIAATAPQEIKDTEMLLGGSITGITEFLSSKLMLKIPQSTAIKNKLIDFVAKTAAGAASEVIQESSESLLQDINHIINTNPDSEISLQQAMDEGEIAGYVGAITQFAINSVLHIRARNTMKTFEQLNDATQAQKLRDRSPGDYQNFADSVAKHLADTSKGKVTDVYVDANVFNQIMNDAGIQRDFINDQFPEIIEQLEEADALGGGDIRLPMNKWIGKVAGTEIGDALTPHVRSSADSLSFAETEQTQQMQGEIELRSQEIIDESVTNKQFNDSARAVESTVFDQIKSTQKYPDAVARNYSSFVRDFYIARAKEEGITPQEVYDRYSLNVVASDQINTQKVLSQAQESGFEGSNQLDDFSKSIEEKHDLESLFLTNLPNRNAIEVSNIVVPEGGRSSGSGTKAMNDIADFADLHGKTLYLNPAHSDDRKGTTSRSRLVKFYKRFGFKENKGRNKDFRFMGGMIREPKSNLLAQSAYHGTPHTFDKFSLDAIGTGEGAQAYGWGMYFAGRKEIGEYYRDALVESAEIQNWSIGTAQIKKMDGYVDYAPMDSSNQQQAKAAFTEAMLIDENTISRAWEDGGIDRAKEVMHAVADSEIESATMDYPEIVSHLKVLKSRIDTGLKFDVKKEKGNLFQVDIPEDSDLIDWDKPVNEQPKLIDALGVQGQVNEFNQINSKLNKMLLEELEDGETYSQDDFRSLEAQKNRIIDEIGFRPDRSFADFHRALEKEKGPQGASSYLNDLGFPGLMYLDSQSRGTGDELHNYVIWDESKVTVEAVNDELLQAEQQVYSQQQIPQTETDAFKAWFDDSQVVDGNGNPLTVYHGTGSLENLESFDPSLTGKGNDQYGSGFYFATESNVASGYATSRIQSDVEKLGGEDSPGVLPVYLSIQNPIKIDADKNSNINDGAIDLDSDQVRKMLDYSEALKRDMDDENMNPAGDHFDSFWSDGIEDYMLDDLANMYAGSRVESIEMELFDGDSESFRKALSDVTGHDGVEITFTETGEKHYVAWFPEQIKSAVGNNGDFDSSNASILKQETRGGFDPSSLTAILNEKADFSTFLHESAHFFLEVYSDLATQPDASDQVKNDMQTLLDWFGVDSLESWNSKTLDERRKAHEQFAYNFEIYLFEGKSPSIQMQKLFDRFSAWLRRVYRSIKEDLNAAYKAENGQDLPILTGEVRDVMDRMLASEDQIEQVQLVRKAVPLYATQDESGMEDNEWHAYQSLRQEAEDVSISELSKDSVRQMKWLDNAKSRVLKEMQRKTANIRKTIKEQVREEVLRDKTFSTMRYLRFGEFVNGDGELITSDEPTKLDAQEIRELYKDVGDIPDYKSLRYGKSGMLSKEGLSPDFVSDMFNFQSADQLIRTLVESPTIEEEVNTRTDKRMMEENADLIDENSIERAVNEALHTEARARFVAVELKHLTKATQPVRVMVEAAKQAAQSILANKKIESIKPKQYVAAEARAAKDVLAAMKKGDTVEAGRAKQRELLNNQLASEAIKIENEIDKITRKFKRIQKKGAQAKMRGDFLEQMNNLLARFDLRTSTTKKQRAEERVPLADFIKSESARISAVMPDLPSWVLADDYKKHYRDLTVDELRDLNDSASQLETMARREEKMYQAVRNQTYEQEVESILGELKGVHPEAFDEDGSPIAYRKDAMPYLKDKAFRARSKFDAEFVNIENLIDVMSAGQGKKIFESLFGRLSKAADTRNEYMKKVGASIAEATRLYTTPERLSMTTKKEKVPGTQRYMTREGRVAVGLFFGSEDGRQRLKDGNGLTDYEIRQIIDSLDEKDVAVLKAFWSTSDNIIWPDLKDLNKRTSGIAPIKVAPAPFQTKHGMVSGGYVPLVYDGDLDSRSLDLNTNQTVEEMLGGNSGTAATQRSASKERVSTVNRPLDLSLRAMAFKINETVHDITHREAIADTYRLLQNNELSNAIRSISGPDVYRAMISRVREVAVKPRVPSGFSEKVFWYLRKNTLVSLMGASFNTVAINVLGVAPSIRRVGSVRFLRALAKFPYHLGPVHKGNKYHDMVIEKSQYMKNRLEGFDRDLNEELGRVLGNQGVMPTLGFWFSGLSAMDRMITMPAWLAAYEKGMELNSNNDSMAIQYADRVIRQTQGSGRPIDLAQIAGGVGTAGEFKRIITMFYNFFSSQLGSLRRGGAEANYHWKKGEKVEAASRLTLDALMIVVVPATLEALARGQCGDDPDASDYLYCSARSTALFTGAFFPIFRDVLPYTWKQFDPEIKSFRVAISPVESALETVARLPKSLSDIVSGEGNEADHRTLVRSFGYLFGLPGSQGWRTLDGFRELSEGQTSDPTVLLTGPRD